MLSWPPSVRIFLAAGPTDMRRGFDGLARMTTEVIRQDPFSGALFVFRDRKGDRVKVLYWAGDGFALWYRRLERGTFRFPACEADAGDLQGDTRGTSARRGISIRPNTHQGPTAALISATAGRPG